MPEFRTIAAVAAALTIGATAPAVAQDRTEFRVAWSIYVGWMPWGYLEDSGIMDKWAEKYGIDVEIVQINDYVESINQYTAGAFDGVSATNMDTLSIPAGGGVDTTALIVGDFSDGNDAVILKGDGELADLAGKPVNLVELSVSHYLLARALDSVGLREADLASVINTSDADMIAAFATPDVEAVVTWNPLVSTILEDPNAKSVFDSSDIPGEIIDLMVVNTETLEANPDFGKALVGAWYEVMGLMAAGDEDVLTAMAEASGTDLAGYQAQLASTQMFYDPADAVAFTQSAELPATMINVAEFLFDKGILGVGAPSADFVGIAYPDGSVTGDEGNVQFRFDTTYMQMAADGAL
ncbi:ABC transporter substrate-binding protein [Ponticoccus sp. SC2-23]|uniref:putative urea ABC transporter substrate-binding protein n=1 Tax=Alexandriicola marinus TaxID=2081710 RepID=UPI000FD8A7CB|nr:putative urea ABC transporter substrate-binding protein [Alexandriicola marinus]MBM1221463.1 ABC transporter substrate-binding protein [Ponticoccus sp. SC6-9]MBM1226504.1 ABC transporter substrate-binding protein [Ponticoccus sp. SC6-15]MBM1230455.1 ABC transporter substrate-binding protein [Ponticoccus sp. SC6-38]MBM1234978.1 ABC transporter substrate-binding protein [Ponticoccus sp. SC6-45]MBM1239476.1 ABC transporter substrate-binding protein [Ponticoccus sp. SC6-49]MBM1243258.1 ABC tra